VVAGTHRVIYLDESGFGLSLPCAYSWTRRGQARCVPRAWGSQGRVNVIGHLEWSPVGAHSVGYCVLEGACRTEAVVAYLEGLAQAAARDGRSVVVFLDNASFHRSAGVRSRREAWARCGLVLYYLPPYSPHRNLMETVWRRVKGSLLPRRFYARVEALREAVIAGLQQLGGKELKI